MQVPAQVEYEKATSVSHALSLLARYGPDARILAGGHSLIPMMKLRLAQPEVLIDVNGLASLRYIRVDRGMLCIGALTTHAQLLESDLAAGHFAILADAERVIADPVVREWGTTGGSLCQADPSRTFPPRSPPSRAPWSSRGQTAPAMSRPASSTRGLYETVVGPGEMLTEIRLPVRAEQGPRTSRSPAGPATGRSARPEPRCGWMPPASSPTRGSG